MGTIHRAVFVLCMSEPEVERATRANKSKSTDPKEITERKGQKFERQRERAIERERGEARFLSQSLTR